MMRKNGRASCILHNFDQIELESKWVENLIRFPGLFSTTLLFTRLNLPYICLQRKNKDFSYRVTDLVSSKANNRHGARALKPMKFESI